MVDSDSSDNGNDLACLKWCESKGDRASMGLHNESQRRPWRKRWCISKQCCGI